MTWFKSAVVYQIWPRSFADGDGDGIGDLEIDLPDDAELLLTSAPQGPRLEAWEARVYRRGT